MNNLANANQFHELISVQHRNSL